MLALPELFNTPYFATATDPRWYAAAEPIPEGPTTGLMRELARRHGMVIVAPFYEQAGAARYNSAAVIDADGGSWASIGSTTCPALTPATTSPSTSTGPTSDSRSSNGVRARRGLHLLRPSLSGDRAHLRGQGRRDRLQSLGDRGRRSEQVWELEQQAHALANGYFVGALNRVGRGQPATARVLRQELLLQPARRDRRPGGAGRRGGPHRRPRPRRDPASRESGTRTGCTSTGGRPRTTRCSPRASRPPRHGKESQPWLTRSEASTTFRS